MEEWVSHIMQRVDGINGMDVTHHATRGWDEWNGCHTLTHV